MLASERIVRAVLITLHRGLVEIRNHSLAADCQLKYINSIAEAIHALPQILLQTFHRGEEEMLEMIHIHLKCLDSSKYTGAPDLNEIFEREITRSSNLGTGA